MRGNGLKRSGIRVAGILALALSMAACSLRPHPLAPWPLPGPGAGPIRGNWVQTVKLERGGRELSLLAVIECDGTVLTLAGLTPAGQRLMRITWRDGRIEQESDPNLPAKVDGEGILRDLVLAYWPRAALDSALAGTEWSVAFSEGRRTLSARGKSRIVIEPEAATPATDSASASAPGPAAASGPAPASADGSGSLRIRHLREKYAVHVATVEKTPP